MGPIRADGPSPVATCLITDRLRKNRLPQRLLSRRKHAQRKAAADPTSTLFLLPFLLYWDPVVSHRDFVTEDIEGKL